MSNPSEDNNIRIIPGDAPIWVKQLAIDKNKLIAQLHEEQRKKAIAMGIADMAIRERNMLSRTLDFLKGKTRSEIQVFTKEVRK